MPRTSGFSPARSLPMRFHSPLAAVLLCLSSFLSAQPLLVVGDVCLDIEAVAIHTEGELAGLTTYRLYATLPGPADIVTTVFGDTDNPTSLQTTTNFYQSELGGQFPCANNPILFDAFPELEWDSWLTIGVDGPPDPTAGEDCPQVVMSTGSPFMTEFENGNGFSIDDLIGSAWFVVPSFTNGLPDEDGRVLLGQVTTDGELSGVFYMQVLPGGVGALAEVVELEFFGPCDHISPSLCPEEIFTVDNGCEWGFEVSNFQPGEAATWTFGDDFVNGGHYAEYTFAGDGTYPVSVTFTSDYCPDGVTLETLVEVEGCSEPECNLELVVETVDSGQVIMVVPVGYPEGAELIYSLNGSVIQEGGTAITLPYGTGENPWQVCVQYVTEDCPDGISSCTGSEDYEPGCPQEIWVGGAGCQYILSICDYTEGEEVSWDFGDGAEGEGHFAWHTYPENGVYEVCATYVSPTCPDGTVLCTALEVEGCEPDLCPLEIAVEWSSPETGQWVLEAVGAPEGVGLLWFGPGGDIIADGPLLDFEGSGTVCVFYESPDCPQGVEACITLEGPDPDCDVEVFVTPLADCGHYLAAYQGGPGSGDVQWYIGGDLAQTGGEAFDFNLESGQVVEVCALAFGEGCPQGEEACVEVAHDGCGPCPEEEEGAIAWEVAGTDEDCYVVLELELDPEAELQSVEWDFGDGTGMTGNTWTSHVFTEAGVYSVCATVLSWGCDAVSYCAQVEVGDCAADCMPVTLTFTPAEGVTGTFNWVMFGEDWAEDGLFWISPEGTPVVQNFCLPEGCYVMDFFALSGSDAAHDVNVTLEGPDGPMEFHEGPIFDENGWQVFTFGAGEGGCEPGEPEGCNLEIAAVEEADGSWTLTAVTDSEEDVDFLWVLSDGSALNGATINHTFVNGVEVVTACVSALFPDCGEVLSACIDLENGLAEGCQAVEVELNGETFVELLEDLEMTWSLLGGEFDLSGSASLDPAQGGLDGLVLCLPPGCYALSMGMQGLPGFQGLPGMTLSLSVDEEQQLELDLMLIDDVIELEFGVFTDCGFSVGTPSGPVGEGLRVFPNPAGDVARVEWAGASNAGSFQWSLCDGLGRVVARGIARESVWELPISRQVTGGYILVVESGEDVRRIRVMVAR